MQGADKKHTTLQGWKSFLRAIMAVNDISSRGNNQIVWCTCDYYAVCVSSAHRYVFQIFRIRPHATRGDSLDDSFRSRSARDCTIKQSIYICLMSECFVLHVKTEPAAIMHFDSELWAQCLSLISLFLNVNRATVTVQRYACWDRERGVSEPDTVSITGYAWN